MSKINTPDNNVPENDSIKNVGEVKTDDTGRVIGAEPRTDDCGRIMGGSGGFYSQRTGKIYFELHEFLNALENSK